MNRNRNFQFVYLHFQKQRLLIGGFSKSTKQAILFSSTQYQYIDDRCVWCTQRALKRPNWKNIFLTFSIGLWISCGMSLLTMAFTIYIYSRIAKNNRDFIWTLIRSLLIIIGFMPGYMPKKALGRIIFALFLLCGVISSTLFQSATVSSTTNQYYQKQISSLSEAISNDFMFTGTGYNYDIITARNDEVISNNIANFWTLFFCLIFSSDFRKNDTKFSYLQ